MPKQASTLVGRQRNDDRRIVGKKRTERWMEGRGELGQKQVRDRRLGVATLGRGGAEGAAGGGLHTAAIPNEKFKREG